MAMTNPDEVVTKQDLHDFYEQIKPYLGSYPIAVANKFSKSDLYDTTEKVIGKWTDGRPIYQKSFQTTMPTVSTDGTEVTGSYISIGANISTLVNAFGSVTDSAGGSIPLLSTKIATSSITRTARIFVNTNSASSNSNKFALISSWAGISGAPAHVTLQYTKTTDSANSYNYANENDYSTSEKIVGKWIDGSYLYQKTITGTTSSSADSVTVATMSGVKIRKMFGVISTTSTDINSSTTQVNIPVSAMKSAGFSDDVNIFSYADNGTVVLFYGSGLNTYRNRGYSLTIQYTK